MGQKFKRMIDSAQRMVRVDAPSNCTPDDVEWVCFEIQGLRVKRTGGELFFPYCDMAEYGVRKLGHKPLSIFDRLRRKGAPVGIAEVNEQGWLQAGFWCDPKLELRFDANNERERELWRECRIMVMSAGFDMAGIKWATPQSW